MRIHVMSFLFYKTTCEFPCMFLCMSTTKLSVHPYETSYMLLSVVPYKYR
uniref:Uncharacterized protein n=1 Tax=Arundo donax TaxID=35708 RepID=A0A0A8YY61_ARUDO